MNDLFLRACLRQPVPRTPVWMMRQAGRYLPEYRAARAKTDFLTLCKTPDLAAEVTVQPVDIIGVDAAIVFSDILVLPEAMGMELIVEEGKGGPRFPNPVRTPGDIQHLTPPDPSDRLKFVLDAIRESRKRLAGRVPLIGFSGSPWTLAAYMIEGKGNKGFPFLMDTLRKTPGELHRLLDKLTVAVASYLLAQIEAGAQAVQIFDTWGGLLQPASFEEFSLRCVTAVVEALRNTSVPIIVFCKDCGHSLKKIAETGCHVVGLDATMNLREARALIGNSSAIQGNLSPDILMGSPGTIRSEVKALLANYGKGPGHIFNLGHGILPGTPVENAKEFVRAVKEESAIFHQ